MTPSLARAFKVALAATVITTLLCGAACEARADAPTEPAPTPISQGDARELPPTTHYEKKPRRGLTAGGAVLFSLAYAPAMVTGILFAVGSGNGCTGYSLNNGPVMWDCPKGNANIASGLLTVPFAGPLMAALAYRAPAWSAGWALLDGTAQVGGLAMMILAAKYPRTVPVSGEAFQLVPFAGPRAQGLQAIGKF